jgi:signal transduction histidine kinase
MFIINAIFLSIANLLFGYMIKHNIADKNMKYYLISFIVLGSGEMIYTYINDVAMQMIWIFPVIMAALYFEKLLIVCTIIGSLLGLIILDIISPITFHPERFDDLKATSLILIVGLIAALYFQFNRTRRLKYTVDNTISAVKTGTSIINHAIKNEIVKISLCTTNIERILTEKGINIEDLKIICDCSNHIINMVDKIQSKIQKTILEKLKVDLSNIINDCLESFTPYFNSKGIKVVKNYNSNVYINCDPLHIKEVFNNLIKNSIEAMKDNGLLEINTKYVGKNIIINIIDNGSGISKENLPRVVDPFFSTKTNKSKNYGLGLTYCYNVIREHNGNLDIQSEINKGTTITLNIPI